MRMWQKKKANGTSLVWQLVDGSPLEIKMPILITLLCLSKIVTDKATNTEKQNSAVSTPQMNCVPPNVVESGGVKYQRTHDMM